MNTTRVATGRIRTYLRELIVLGMTVSSLMYPIAPMVAYAAAPQDTYTWQRTIGISGCAPGPNALTVVNNRVYVTDGTATSTIAVHIFDVSGNPTGSFGNYGTSDGQVRYPTGIVHDASGNLYILDSGNYRVQKFDANGNFLMKFGSNGTGNGQFQNPQSLAIDASGNLYVGDMSRHDVQKFDANGNFLMKFGSNGTGNGQFSYIEGVAVDASGTIYVSDTDYSSISRVQRFDSTGTYLSTFGGSGSGDGQFSQVGALALDASGNILVVDGNNRVQTFSSSGVYISQFGSTGTGNGQFNSPSGIALDASGNIYVANADYSWTSGTGRVQKFDSAGNYLTQFTYGSSSNICGPQAGTIGPDGNLYITDGRWLWGGWDNIKVYDRSGNLLRTFGSSGTGAGQLDSPADLAFDKNGDLYVVDQGNNRIVKYRSDGTYLSEFGTRGAGNGQFGNIYGIAVDGSGNIYVTDNGVSPSYVSRVQKFTSSGQFISSFGGNGTGDGQFNFAADIAINSQGDIYVVDTNNSRVQKFDANGTYVSQFDGVGTNGIAFGTAYGIAIDANDNIYISDSYKMGIRKFDSKGNFLTSFNEYGTGAGKYAGATLGVAVDSDGNVYAVDNGSANDGVPSRVVVWNAPIIPSSPQNVTAAELSSTSMRVTWAQPAHVGSSSLLGYRVLYRQVAATDWKIAVTTDAATFSYTITGLAPSQQYDVQVVAYNAIGVSTDVASYASEGVAVVSLGAGILASTGSDIATLAKGAVVFLGLSTLAFVSIRHRSTYLGRRA